jgi:hypothetical protein
MGYILNEPKTFINVKLTDVGRRQLSLGNLTFVSAVLSDREVDYSIDRGNPMRYDISNNRILSPLDDNPIISTNFDGSQPITLEGNQLVSSKQFSTGATESYGFFTGTTSLTATTAVDTSKLLGSNTITYATSPIDGGYTVTLDNLSPSDYYPNAGDLVYIPWEPIQNSGKTYSGNIIDTVNPTVGLWYRVTSTNGSTDISLDRPIPDFGGVVSTSQIINAYFYPFNGGENYYGTGTTVNPSLWNMNIVRTQSVVGRPLNVVSGYTSYGSIEYNGTKQYLGFTGDTQAVGILHYTNEFTGNTYAEQLLEKTVRIDLPNVMWHNISGDNGKTLSYGLTLYDIDGDTEIDDFSNTTYRNLKDGVTSSSNVVGRVYHKLKIAVITDPELLNSLTYKSNRNYTIPPLNISTIGVPKYPLTTSQATGLVKSGKTYFVTYLTESESTFSATSPDTTFGYPKSLHCGYIQKLNGQVDDSGNYQYLSATFPTNTFPYLRNSQDMLSSSSYSGTGWNANKVQLLVAEVDDPNAVATIEDVNSNSWKLISNGVGNGIYTGSTSDNTIDARDLNAFQFIISQEDYDSGTTYVLDNIFTDNSDHSTTGLTFGDESFLFGNLKSDIMATTYKTVITTFAKNDSFNSSINGSFDDTLDSDTYITEVGILDGEGNLVAVGKPTYPIKKNEGRFLTFQLQIDF